MQTKIASKGTAYSMIASTAAQAFVIHAEGNETENASAATTLATLVNAADIGKAFIGDAKAQELKDMASSMLQDKSQYGTERENVTNDLMLSIELPEATTGIMNADSHVDVIPSECYSIHGIKVARPTKGIYISNGKKVVIK